MRPFIMVHTAGNIRDVTQVTKLWLAFIDLDDDLVVHQEELNFKFAPQKGSHGSLCTDFQLASSSELVQDGLQLMQRY